MAPLHDSNPFFHKPVHIPPLKIAHKSHASSPISLRSVRTLSPLAQCTSLTPQTMLEGNVRILCDMVDSILKNNNEYNHKPPRIDTSNISTRDKSFENQHPGGLKSPIIAFSPRVSSLLKNDISKRDDTAIPESSQREDPLLNLFPMPPPRNNNLTLKSRNDAETVIPSPLLGSNLQQPRPRKNSKNRNWVITSGLFLTPSADDSEDPTSRLVDVELDWDIINREEEMNHFQSPCNPSLESNPSSEAKDMQDNYSINLCQEEESLEDACPTSPSIGCPSSVSSQTFDNSASDALSQHLWDTETQMRRSSFLMSDSNATSPTTEKFDQQERLFAELSLTVGSTEVPCNDAITATAVTQKEFQTKDTTQPVKETTPQEMDWRAWHGAWTRKRVKPINDGTSDTASSSKRTSRATTASPNCSPPTTPTYPSKKSQWPGSTRRYKNSSLPSPFESFAPSPPSPIGASSPIKDANPELWESEGLKWGDRFQLLVHNFQSTAGKHSKRLVDILPVNRWSKRSRSRTTSGSEKT
ncbi:hypothetical protein BGZ46_010115 [Entomortierella lignicola]|nr:hypothetical protein BGZ46_010115 [Entomortierella lignicola]